MPASDASVQFTKQSLVGQFIPTGGIAINPSTSATRSVYTPITMLYDGTIGQVIVAFVYTFTGNVKMALFANGANIPTTLLGAANVLTNPVIGNNVFTFPSPPSVSKGVQYWVGIEGDGTHASCFNGNSNQGVFSNQSYASFPTSNPSTGTGAEGIQTTVLVTPAGNYVCVYEAQQDGLTTTVQDANPGDADFYGLAPLAIVPNAVIATNLRAYAQKSDVGTRILAAQLKSGATTVATPNVVLNSPGFQWVSRMDVTDPNTGLAWSPTAIDVVQIGPQLIA
jgi:hypothetical protein